MTNVTEEEGNNTNIISTESDSIKLRGEGTVALTENNQDTEDGGEETTERIAHGFVGKIGDASALTNISTTETNVDTCNTSPRDEARDSSNTQEPNESLFSTDDCNKVSTCYTVIVYSYITCKWKQRHRQSQQLTKRQQPCNKKKAK